MRKFRFFGKDVDDLEGRIEEEETTEEVLEKVHIALSRVGHLKEIEMMQIDKITDVRLTITHLLEENLVSSYVAEKILWALLSSVDLFEDEEGRRSEHEVLDLVELQRQLLLKEMDGIGAENAPMELGRRSR
ncbi:MAG TPA: hypothetical protein VN922_20535 [Bacteroidia bacterium]|nr:hypothetical protein [Bacteroidia bacterium]